MAGTLRPVAWAKQEEVAEVQGAVNELSARLAVVEYALESLLDDFDQLVNALSVEDERAPESVTEERPDRYVDLGEGPVTTHLGDEGDD